MPAWFLQERKLTLDEMKSSTSAAFSNKIMSIPVLEKI